MNNKQSTSNKLFLVCPFSQMENFITNHFGEVFFLTAPAAVFSFENIESNEEVKLFLQRKKITDIYLVSDTDCRFINNVITGNNLSGLSCENIINELKTADDTPFTLSKKLIFHQLNELNSVALFGDEMKSGNIKLHGIVSSKKENKLSTII